MSRRRRCPFTEQLDGALAKLAELQVSFPAGELRQDPSLGPLVRQCHASSGKLQVVVLGSSPTMGLMNCAGTNCTEHRKERWSNRLDELLTSALAPCTVVMANAARGGLTSASALDRLSDQLSSGIVPSVVITDFTINDRSTRLPNAFAKQEHALRSQDQYRSLGQLESFARHVAALRPRPAFVHYDTWPRFPPRCECGREGRQHVPMRACVLDTEQARVAAFYNGSVVSMAAAICDAQPQAADAAERAWPGGCGELDTAGTACTHHPGPAAHARAATLLAAHVLSAACAAHGGSDVTGGGSDAHRMMPQPAIVLEEAPSILPLAALAANEGCYRMRAHATTIDVTSTCGLPLESEGWRCFEDRPGKRGWISGVGSGALTWRLGVCVGSSCAGSGGKVVVGYLRSYSGLGAAAVWLDGDRQLARIINGSWAERASQTDYLISSAASLCGQSCRAVQSAAAAQLAAQRAPNVASLLDVACGRGSGGPPAGHGHFQAELERHCPDAYAACLAAAAAPHDCGVQERLRTAWLGPEGTTRPSPRARGGPCWLRIFNISASHQERVAVDAVKQALIPLAPLHAQSCFGRGASPAWFDCATSAPVRCDNVPGTLHELRIQPLAEGAKFKVTRLAAC